MIYTELTKKAMKLCFEAHKEQKDRGGLPYVFHPFHVAESMIDEDSTVVALLHDVIEDTDYTIDDLRKMGFNDQVLEALKLMTHDKNEDYYRYIKRIKENDLAKFVKMADLKHNSDLSRLDHEPGNEDLQRYAKYRTSIYMLEGRVFSFRSQSERVDNYVALFGRKTDNVICGDKDGVRSYTINPNIIVEITQQGAKLLGENELVRAEDIEEHVFSRHEYVISDGDTGYVFGTCNNMSFFAEDGREDTTGRKILDFYLNIKIILIKNGVDGKYFNLV